MFFYLTLVIFFQYLLYILFIFLYKFKNIIYTIFQKQLYIIKFNFQSLKFFIYIEIYK